MPLEKTSARASSRDPRTASASAAVGESVRPYGAPFRGRRSNVVDRSRTGETPPDGLSTGLRTRRVSGRMGQNTRCPGSGRTGPASPARRTSEPPARRPAARQAPAAGARRRACGPRREAVDVVCRPGDGLPPGRGELASVVDDALEVAVLAQELGGRLLPDALRARDVVGGVAAQGDQVDHLFRLDAVALHHLRRADLLGLAAAADRDQHRRPLGHQLEAVAVRGQHEVGAAARLLGGHGRGQQVVGLPGIDLGRREAEGLGQLRQEVELGGQVLGEGIPSALVLGQQLVAV